MDNLNPTLIRDWQSENADVSLTPAEQNTLRAILGQVSREENSRYKQLRKKLRAETLTEQEHQELMVLSDKREGVQVQRLEYLVEVAKKHNLNLRDFMDALQLKSPTNG